LHFTHLIFFNPILWDLVQKLVNSGVKLRPWLLVDKDHGYWANVGNAAYIEEQAMQLSNLWTNTYGLQPTTFIIDMEPSWQDSATLNQLKAKGNFIAVIKFLRSKMNLEKYDRAKSIYMKLIEKLHAAHWKVDVTTIPLLLDGHRNISEAFGCVIDGLPWDKITFQVYRTAYQSDPTLQKFGHLNSYLIYMYAKEALKRYGSIAGIDLGATYPVNQGYNSETFRDDVSAALAAGISPKNINLYSLAGIYGQLNATWTYNRNATQLWFISPQPVRPSFNLPALIARAGDKVLDIGLLFKNRLKYFRANEVNFVLPKSVFYSSAGNNKTS